MSNNKTSLAEARRALINLDFCGPGEHGDGDPEIAAIDAAENFVNHALEFAVLTLAFLGRDRGTDRLDKTLDDICDLARNIDKEARSLLPTPFVPDGH